MDPFFESTFSFYSIHKHHHQNRYDRQESRMCLLVRFPNAEKRARDVDVHLYGGIIPEIKPSCSDSQQHYRKCKYCVLSSTVVARHTVSTTGLLFRLLRISSSDSSISQFLFRQKLQSTTSLDKS